MIIETHDKPWTLQEVFNNAWQHAVVEKNPPCFSVSVSDGAGCLYRKDNNACLIGISIPNDIFDKKMNASGGINVLISNFQSIRNLFAKIDSDALLELQRCHDKFWTKTLEIIYIDKIKSELINFAKIYKLTIPEGN